MIHLQALFIGTGILLGAMAIAVLTHMAVITFGLGVLAVPFVILFIYALGRICLEMWGTIYR